MSKYESVIAADYVALCENCERIMKYNGKWVCEQCGAKVTIHKKKEVV